MADAGKIMIVPKGAYDASVSYEILDLVTHNDIVWVAKKDVTGVEPSDANAEYWFKMVDDNVSKLGGKSASEYALDADLANYMPLSGLKNFTNWVGLQKDGLYHSWTSANGRIGMYDDAHGKWVYYGNDEGVNVFNGTASGNVALDGGSETAVISRNKSTVAMFKNKADSDRAWIELSAQSNILGYFGFLGVDNPVFSSPTSGANHTLLHTGNKPTGSYTGNGSTATRTINVGGFSSAQCFCCFVCNPNGIAFVNHRHAVVITSDGSKLLTKNQAYFESGDLILNTDNNVLNGSGHSTNYIVL